MSTRCRSAANRLPLTAIAMVLGIGGPPLATLTSLVTVAIAYAAGAGLERALVRSSELWPMGR